jgi:hypothetical protein
VYVVSIVSGKLAVTICRIVLAHSSFVVMLVAVIVVVLVVSRRINKR